MYRGRGRRHDIYHDIKIYLLKFRIYELLLICISQKLRRYLSVKAKIITVINMVKTQRFLFVDFYSSLKKNSIVFR